LLELNLSTRALQQNIAKDAADVEAYYAQKLPPSPASEAEILVHLGINSLAAKQQGLCPGKST
jgi:hypothetical protein